MRSVLLGYYSPVNAGFWIIEPNCRDFVNLLATYAHGFDESTATKQGRGWTSFGPQPYCGSLHCGMGCWHAKTFSTGNGTASLTTPYNVTIRGFNYTNCTETPVSTSSNWDFHGASADQGLLLHQFVLQKRYIVAMFGGMQSWKLNETCWPLCRRTHTILPMTTFQRLGLLHFAGGTFACQVSLSFSDTQLSKCVTDRKPWLLPCFTARSVEDASLCINRTRGAWPPEDYKFWYRV